jgi:hypothetical protein
MRLPIFKEEPMPALSNVNTMLAIIAEARSSLAFRPHSLDIDMMLIALVDLKIFPLLTSYYRGLSGNQQKRFRVKWREWMLSPLVTKGDLDLTDA